MLTKKTAANILVKVGIKRVRNKLKTEYANTPPFLAEMLIDQLGVESMLPVKAAAVINNSDYTVEQVKRLIRKR